MGNTDQSSTGLTNVNKEVNTQIFCLKVVRLHLDFVLLVGEAHKRAHTWSLVIDSVENAKSGEC